LKLKILPFLKSQLILNSRIVISNIEEGLAKSNVISNIIKNVKEDTKTLFDTVILDNAHLVPEIETTFVFNELRPGKIVLVGDPNQPKTNLNVVQHGDQLHFNRSLMERLISSEGGSCVLNQQIRLGRFLLEAVSQANNLENQVFGKPVDRKRFLAI
jgi:hypothetical protein